MLLLQTNEISADQITNCNQFGLPNGATHSPGGPEPSHIFGGGIWLAKRTLKRSDRVSVQAISEAKYISAQQNIKLVQASLPLNRELQFKGKPQGLTVTRFSSRYTHPVFCVIAINKFLPEPSHIFGGGIWLAKRTLKRSDRVSVQAISEAKYISALQQKKHPALSNRVLFVRRRIFIGASTSSATFITSCRPCHPCPGP